jgi:hypothetical protein
MVFSLHFMGGNCWHIAACCPSFEAAHPKLYEYKTYCMRSAVGRGYTLSAAGRRRVYNFSVSGACAPRPGSSHPLFAPKSWCCRLEVDVIQVLLPQLLAIVW